MSCSNCGRPICPDCMTPTPVGMRCPECARDRTTVKTIRDISGPPRVMAALIAINVVVFLATGQFSVGGSSGGGKLFADGVLFGPSIHVNHEYYRLVTSGFLHEGFLHIALNMYVLYLLGQVLEPAIGSARFALVYFVSMLAGSCGALLVTPDSFTVGASGAIFGLAGFAFVDLRARGFDPFSGGFGSIGMFIVLNLALSFGISGISVGGHIGGLVGGGLCGLAFAAAGRARQPALAYAGCALVAAASVAGALAAAAATSPVIG